MAPRYPTANAFGTFLKTMNEFESARTQDKPSTAVDTGDALRVVELLSARGGKAPLRDIIAESGLGPDKFLALLQSSWARDLFHQRETGDTVELELTTLGRQFAR